MRKWEEGGLTGRAWGCEAGLTKTHLTWELQLPVRTAPWVVMARLSTPSAQSLAGVCSRRAWPGAEVAPEGAAPGGCWLLVSLQGMAGPFQRKMQLVHLQGVTYHL